MLMAKGNPKCALKWKAMMLVNPVVKSVKKSPKTTNPSYCQLQVSPNDQCLIYFHILKPSQQDTTNKQINKPPQQEIPKYKTKSQSDFTGGHELNFIGGDPPPQRIRV